MKKLIKNIIITPEELEILKEISDRYKYIARNTDNSLVMYTEPYFEKNYSEEEIHGSEWVVEASRAYINDSHLFRFIQWEDKNVWSISDIIENCKVKTENKEIKNLNTELHVSDVIAKEPFVTIKWSDGIETIAKCNNVDTFDVEKGVYVAIAKRVLSHEKIKEIVKKAEKSHHYSDRIVCIESKCREYTVGKIYNIKDGYLIDDNGIKKGKYHSFAALQSDPLTKFIRIVE